jgi:hypothetical protein
MMMMRMKEQLALKYTLEREISETSSDPLVGFAG